MANRILLKIIVYIFFLISLTSHYGHCKTASILIGEQKKDIKLNKKVEYFLSKDNLSLEQVRTKKFISHEKGVLNFGYNFSNCWIHLHLKNGSMVKKNIVLEITYTSLDFVDFYGFEIDNPQKIKVLKIGDRVPFEQREVKHRNFIFPLEIKKEMDIYIRVQTSGVLTVPIKLWPSNFSFFENDRKSHTFFCIYYGMLIVMILYNSFIFFSTRDKNYIYYVICLTSFMFTQLSFNGFNNEIWTNSPNWNNVSLLSFAALYLLTLLWFAKNYLNTQLYTPKINIFFISLIVLLGIIILFTLVSIFPYSLIVVIGGWLCILISFTIFVTSILILKKHHPAMYFILALFMALLGLITRPLMNAGILSYNIFTENAMQIGSAFEFILFSLGLGYKINLLQQEKSTAQQKIIKIQETSQAKLKEKNEELSRLNRLKDNFLANTSHDLRTPLHGIIGISECLVDKPDVDADTQKDLLSIIYSARRLSNLVNDLLDATKIKKGAIVLKKISCDLKIAVDSTIDMTAALNRTKKLAIENKIPDGLPCVLADEGRLLQILQNLIENAIKYTESGSILITAKPINSDYVECAVTDTGIGIPERDLDKIFLSFTQGNMNNAGSGLGLSITKSLVELHGGHISVSSKEGTTSTFKFTMPVSSGPSQIRKEDCVLANKFFDKPTPVFLKSETNKNNPFKIIAIDDDIINLKILNNILISSDFQVIAESSGENIVEIIRTDKPDLILLDIMMPEVDGFQVCKNIRKYYSIEKLPILFLTAKNQISDLVHGFKLGGNDYIIKPFSKDELLSRIDTHLKLKTANYRLKELRNFSNSIGDTNSMRDLIITAGKYLSLDKLVSSVAIFYDGNMIFSFDNPMDSKTIKNLIQLDGSKDIEIVEYKGSAYLSANLENNYVILCELVKNSAAAYVKNILFQIRAIQNNTTKLINNKQVLSSVYRVSKHLENCNYIKGEGKYTRLYTRNDNHFIELQLGQLEMFFYQFLWRVHRSYLVNSKNILRINKTGRGLYNIYFTNGESIPVGNKYKNIISQLKVNG